MKRIVLLILLFLTPPGLASAQSAPSCDSGYACQNVPWRLPALPGLASPTHIPTTAVTAVPTATAAPTSTVAPTPTGQAPPPNPLSTLDLAVLQAQVATLDAVIQSTPIQINDQNGSYATPGGTPQMVQYASNAGTFLGYVKGLGGLNFGALTPMILLFLGSFILAFGLKLASIVAPIGAMLFGIVRKVVSLILDFLPL